MTIHKPAMIIMGMHLDPMRSQLANAACCSLHVLFVLWLLLANATRAIALASSLPLALVLCVLLLLLALAVARVVGAAHCCAGSCCSLLLTRARALTASRTLVVCVCGTVM